MTVEFVRMRENERGRENPKQIRNKPVTVLIKMLIGHDDLNVLFQK